MTPCDRISEKRKTGTVYELLSDRYDREDRVGGIDRGVRILSRTLSIREWEYDAGEWVRLSPVPQQKSRVVDSALDNALSSLFYGPKV